MSLTSYRNGRVIINTHLRQKPVDVDSLKLAKAVDPEDTLNVVGGVPGGVEDDDPVGSHQVDAERASSSRNEEQTTSVEACESGRESRDHA